MSLIWILFWHSGSLKMKFKHLFKATHKTSISCWVPLIPDALTQTDVNINRSMECSMSREIKCTEKNNRHKRESPTL